MFDFLSVLVFQIVCIAGRGIGDTTCKDLERVHRENSDVLI